jgi:hypothetical protein
VSDYLTDRDPGDECDLPPVQYVPVPVPTWAEERERILNALLRSFGLTATQIRGEP